MSIVLPSTYTDPLWALWAAGQPVRDADWLREVQNRHRLYADLGARVPLWLEEYTTASVSYTQTNSSAGHDLDIANPCVRFTRPYQVGGTTTYGLLVYVYGDNVRVQVTPFAPDTNTTFGSVIVGTGSWEWASTSTTFTPAQVGAGGVSGAAPRPITLGLEALSLSGTATALQAYAIPVQITASQLPTE